MDNSTNTPQKSRKKRTISVLLINVIVTAVFFFLINIPNWAQASTALRETFSQPSAVQQAYPAPDFDPELQANFGQPGETIPHLLTLSNDLEADNFNLILQPGHIWTTTLSITQTGRLDPGESIPITVWVTIPPQSVLGDMDSVTLRAEAISSTLPITISADTRASTAFICPSNVSTSGQSEHTTYDSDDIYEFFGQKLAYVQLYAHSSGSYSLDVLVSGFNETTQTWETIAQQTNSGSNIIVDDTFVPPLYNKIRVQLVDDYGNETYYDYQFVVCREDISYVELRPTVQQGIKNPGETAVYTQTVHNFMQFDDTFDLTVSDNAWPTTLWQGDTQINSSGILSDTASTEFIVKVEIPTDADPAAQDTTIIHATSVTTPSITHTATITTLAKEYDAYVFARYENLALVLDTASQNVIDTIDLDAVGCDRPTHATMSPDGQFIYVACQYSNIVTILATADNSIVATIDNINDPGGIAFTQDNAFALIGSASYQSRLTIVDTATGFLQYWTMPEAPREIVMHPYLNKAYAIGSDGDIFIFTPIPFSIEATITGNDSLNTIAISPDGNWLYVGNNSRDRLEIYATYNNTLHTTIPELDDIKSITVAPGGNRIYVTTGINLYLIDTHTFEIVSSLTSEIYFEDTAVTCNGNNLYNSHSSQTLSIYGTDPFTFTKQIQLPANNTNAITICPQHAATGVFLTPESQTEKGKHNETVVYQERITNATGESDSFSLAIGNHEWDTELSETVVGPIAAGETMTFSVSVTVPPDAVWHSSDTVVVTATSLSTPSEFSHSAAFTTEAYAAPEISVNPQSFAVAVEAGSTTVEELNIGNGDSVELEFEIDTFGDPGVHFSTASTELYGYAVSGTYVRVIGLEDDTAVELIDLSTGSILDSTNTLHKFQVWATSINNGTYYKIKSDKPIVTLAQFSGGDFTTFVPSIDANAVGRQHIFYFQQYYGMSVYTFAIEDAEIEVKDASGRIIATKSVAAGNYWKPVLPSDGVYHFTSSGKVAIEILGENSYTTVPDLSGAGSGKAFYFATYNYSSAIAIFAYDDVAIKLYDMDNDELLLEEQITKGNYLWQTGFDGRRLRLESSGTVELWAGSTEGGPNIEDLGDDISIAGGAFGREYFTHALQGGNVIFAPFDFTTINIDGTSYTLMQDETLQLNDCCTLNHITSNHPILIQTVGKANYWNDGGTYLGGKSLFGGQSPTWLSANPVTGTVAANTTTPISLLFDATEMQPGEYSAEILVYNNDPNQPYVNIPVSLTVEPTATMGWVEGNVTDADTGAPLAATITATGQPFTTTTEPTTGYYKFWLPAGTHSIQVMLNGYVSESTSIEIIAQQGASVDFALMLDAPLLNVSPSQIQVTHDVGDITRQTLTVTNDGSLPLTFNVFAGTSPEKPLETVLEHLNAQFNAINSVIPNRYDFIGGVTGDYINDGGFDMYDGGNRLGTDLGGNIQYSDNLIQPSAYFGSNGRYFTRKYPGLFILAADIENINHFEITGSLGADGYGNADGTILETNVNGNVYHGFIKRVYNAGDPSVNHLVIVPNNPAADHSFDSNTNNDYHQINNLTASSRIYYLLYAGLNGAYIDDAATLNIMNAFLEALDPLPNSPWLSAVPISGTVAGFNSLPVKVTLDATALQPGTYSSTIYVDSNAPITPAITIPVTMVVEATDNMGWVEGFVSDIQTSEPLEAVISASGQPFSVTAVVDTGYYRIWLDSGPSTLNISAPGYLPASINTTIVAQQGITENVALIPNQPSMVLTPTNLYANLQFGETTTQIATIYNNGPAELNYHIIEHENTTGFDLLAAHSRTEEEIAHKQAVTAMDDNNRGNPTIAPIPVDVIKSMQGGTRILAWTLYTDYDQEYENTLNAIAEYTTFTLTETDTVDPLVLEALLNEAEVFLIPEQEQSYFDQLFAIGSEWSGILQEFVSNGGVIVVLDQCQRSAGIITGSGLMTFYQWSCYYFNETVTVVDPSHPLAAGVSPAFIFENDFGAFELTNGDQIIKTMYGNYTVAAARDSGTGHIVYINSDYFAYNDDMARLLANAVLWAHQDVTWLSTEPSTGSVPGYSNAPLQVAFNTNNLSYGIYSADLIVTSNDPAVEEDRIQVQLSIHADCSNVAPTPVDVAINALNNQDVQLSWNGNPTNYSYKIFHDTTPNINFDAPPMATLPGGQTQYLHEFGIGDPTINYFYVVRVLNCDGTLTADSNLIGEFDFSIVPGRP